MKAQLIEDLTSAKGQLEYVNGALASNLESWERNEYEQVRSSLTADIESLESRINLF